MKRHAYGFTVVELVIVIVVLGILVAISVPRFGGIMEQSRDTERKTDISSLSMQLEQYYSRHGAYPSQASLNNSTFRSNNRIGTGDNDSWLADPNNSSNKTLSSADSPDFVYSYITQPSACTSPTDNSGAQSSTSNPCTKYSLVARLESAGDTDIDDSWPGSGDFYVKRSAAL